MEGERESIHIFVWAKYGLNGRENEEKKGQNKRKMKRRKNFKVKV